LKNFMHFRKLVPLLGLSLVGCVVIPWSERGNWEIHRDTGAGGEEKTGYGVRFEGAPDCVQADTSALDLSGSFTLETYLLTDDQPGYADYAIFAWPGVFALYYTKEGYLVASATDEPGADAGPSSPVPFMDGGCHQVVVNYVQGGDLTLYLDGTRMAYAPTKLDYDPGETLSIGCWYEQEAWFKGVIGEVRLSSEALYGDDYDPQWRMLPVDDSSTEALWHLDEQRGEEIHDAAQQADGVLTGGSWEPFLLVGEPQGCSDLAVVDTGV